MLTAIFRQWLQDGNSQTVNFTVPGAPTSIAIAADPTSVVAGGTSLITVTLRGLRQQPRTQCYHIADA